MKLNYNPLTPAHTPHDLLWDDADTKKQKTSFMPFYFIFEARSEDEGGYSDEGQIEVDHAQT